MALRRVDQHFNVIRSGSGSQVVRCIPFAILLAPHWVPTAPPLAGGSVKVLRHNYAYDRTR